MIIGSSTSPDRSRLGPGLLVTGRVAGGSFVETTEPLPGPGGGFVREAVLTSEILARLGDEASLDARHCQRSRPGLSR